MAVEVPSHDISQLAHSGNPPIILTESGKGLFEDVAGCLMFIFQIVLYGGTLEKSQGVLQPFKQGHHLTMDAFGTYVRDAQLEEIFAYW
jgi:hypothetical protein